MIMEEFDPNHLGASWVDLPNEGQDAGEEDMVRHCFLLEPLKKPRILFAVNSKM